MVARGKKSKASDAASVAPEDVGTKAATATPTSPIPGPALPPMPLLPEDAAQWYFPAHARVTKLHAEPLFPFEPCTYCASINKACFTGEKGRSKSYDCAECILKNKKDCTLNDNLNNGSLPTAPDGLRSQFPDGDVPAMSVTTSKSIKNRKRARDGESNPVKRSKRAREEEEEKTAPMNEQRPQRSESEATTTVVDNTPPTPASNSPLGNELYGDLTEMQDEGSDKENIDFKGAISSTGLSEEILGTMAARKDDPDKTESEAEAADPDETITKVQFHITEELPAITEKIVDDVPMPGHPIEIPSSTGANEELETEATDIVTMPSNNNDIQHTQIQGPTHSIAASEHIRNRVLGEATSPGSSAASDRAKRIRNLALEHARENKLLKQEMAKTNEDLARIRYELEQTQRRNNELQMMAQNSEALAQRDEIIADLTDQLREREEMDESLMNEITELDGMVE